VYNVSAKVSFVRLSGRKTRCVCVVLALALVGMLGALTASNSLLKVPVLGVAAQTRPASSNTTVSNNVRVLSDSVSLGSRLYVAGVVSTPKGPLASVPVALHMGGITVARTQTNESGAYVFSLPVGVNCVPAVLSGSVNVYTVAEPGDPAFPAATSAVASLPVSQAPAYFIIAVVTGAVVLGIYLYFWPRSSRRVKGRPAATRKRFPSLTRAASRRQEGAEAPPQPAPPTKPPRAAETTEEGSPPLPESERALPPKPTGDAAAVKEAFERWTRRHALRQNDRIEAAKQPALESEPARELPPKPTGDAAAVKEAFELFERGDDRQAIGVLYDAAFASLATRATVTLPPHMTHWERYGALEAAVPEVREPLRTLTVAFERTHYGRKSLTEEQQNAAIAAFQSISALAKPVEENT